MSRITMTTADSIPLVDISGYGIGTGDDAATTFLKDGKADAMAKEITQSLETYGAVLITGHGVQKHVLNDLYEANKKFCLCSDEQKKKYAFDETVIHGWLGTASEKYKGVAVKYSESFGTVGYPSETNRSWPDDLCPGFLGSFSRAYDDSAELGKRLMTLLGLGMGLKDVTYLRDMHFRQPSALSARVNYYRPLSKDEVVDPPAQRFGEHTDLNSATIVYITGDSGLQIKVPKSGCWLAVPYTADDSVFFQVGDALTYISNGRLPTSVHRVMFPESGDRFKERQSFAFFISGLKDQVLVSLDSSKPVEPITFNHFFKLYADVHLNKDKLKM